MEASWRLNVWSNDEWASLHDPSPIEIFTLPTLGITQLHFDLMHVKALGTDCYVLGSWIAFTVDHLKVMSLGDLWKQVVALYKATTAGIIWSLGPVR
eukprot:926268-Amphidinium_carterae.2